MYAYVYPYTYERCEYDAEKRADRRRLVKQLAFIPRLPAQRTRESRIRTRKQTWIGNPLKMKSKYGYGDSHVGRGSIETSEWKKNWISEFGYTYEYSYLIEAARRRPNGGIPKVKIIR